MKLVVDRKCWFKVWGYKEKVIVKDFNLNYVAPVLKL
jgi:hypothetical protein